MKRWSDWIDAHSNWRTAIVLFALLAVFNLAFFYPDLPFSITLLRQQSGGQTLLDMIPGYTPEQAYHILDAYGPAGRATYGHILSIDLVYPLVYGSALAVAVSLALRGAFAPSSIARRLNLVPVLAALFDYVENIGEFLMWLDYPARLYDVALVTSGATTAKLGLMTLIFVGLGVAIVVWAARRLVFTHIAGKSA